MSKRLEIDMGLNASGVAKGAKDAEKSLEDLQDALKDVGRNGARDADDLEDALKDVQRQADRTADEMGDVGDKTRDGFRKAEDGVEEFRDEANSTAREAAASFDGSAESIADAFQEVAANAFAGFGPAGAVAGLAAAAGIGLAVAGFENLNEAEKESRERAAEWADAYVEAGSRILSATQLVEKSREIITDPEQYKKAQENAENWGVAESVALLAMAGDTNALTEARESLADKETLVSEALEKSGGDVRGLSNDMRLMREDVSTGTAALDALNGEMEAGWQQADVLSEALKLVARNTEGATTTVDEFGDSIVTLPDGKQIYIDAETGQATESVNAIETKIYGIPDGKATVRVSADTSSVDRAMRRLSGTTLKIGARIVTSGSGWDQ